MSVSLLIASVLLAQPASQLEVYGAGTDKVDVAYEELMAGNNRGAVERIRASRLDDEGDPAALINLGTAYARLGETGKARNCYMAALTSDTPYMLELADGRWVNSRRAAKMAFKALAGKDALALR